MIAHSGQRGRTLVGREHERRYLAELLDGAIAGAGVLALVDGEAGIGKTTLVDALAHDAADHSVTVAYGHCYKLASTTPYSLWIDLTRGQVANDPRLGRSDQPGADRASPPPPRGGASADRDHRAQRRAG